MISKNIITKTLIASSSIIAGGSLLLAAYFYKPRPIDLSRDEFLNATKSTRTWTEKDTQELLNKLEEFNKDLCKTYYILHAPPKKEAIEQAKGIDQIPQLVIYRQLVSELEKKEWGILPIVIAAYSRYTYPLFVEVPNPTTTDGMKIKSVHSEKWLAGLLWNMRVHTQILPKCEKYYSDNIIKGFKISAEPPPEHREDSDTNQSQQQNSNTSNNNNNFNISSILSNNNNNNINNTNTTKQTNNTNTTEQTVKNKNSFDEEFRRRQEEFERKQEEFERKQEEFKRKFNEQLEKFNEEWKNFDEQFNKQQH